MDIVIPTLGRAYRQTTYQNLPRKWQDRVRLVVQREDYEAHQQEYDQYDPIVLPAAIKNIADTRHYLLHECEELTDDRLLMLDDDMVFSARREDEPTKFRQMDHTDYDSMFGYVSLLLTRYAHAGISHREGANRNTDEKLMVSRMMRALGYNKKYMKRECLTFGRIPVMEDFDITLQLLRRGYPNVIANQWVHNQGGSDTSGGCSTFRTPELQAEAAHALANFHPGFVKVVKKTTKTSWGGGERTDVTVYWKRAYQSYVGDKRHVAEQE